MCPVCSGKLVRRIRIVQMMKRGGGGMRDVRRSRRVCPSCSIVVVIHRIYPKGAPV